MQSYRFYGFSRRGARELAEVLTEDGLAAAVVPPEAHPLPGWAVDAEGEYRSEGLLETLAHFFGGFYEGEDLTGP